ncbi:hypothetical protein N9L20_01905 [Flavobacteriaceae bacterium]|nr:hypothetical protein [Flavobacteriaceae bacterium]
MKKLIAICILIVSVSLSNCDSLIEPIVPEQEQNKEILVNEFGSLLTNKIDFINESFDSKGNLLISNKNLDNELNPLVNKSKELIKAFDISENEINEYFNDPEDPRLGIVGLLIYTSETKQNFNYASIPLFTLNKQWECIAEAIGVPSALIAGNMKKMTVKALLKSVAKMSGRLLGYIGLAWAIADYTSCMGYW